MKLLYALLVVCLLTANVVAQDKSKDAVVTSKPAPESTLAEVESHLKDSQIFDLDYQNFQLKVQFEEARLKAASTKLRADRAALEVKIKEALGAPSDSEVDWSTKPPTVTWPKK